MTREIFYQVNIFFKYIHQLFESKCDWAGRHWFAISWNGSYSNRKEDTCTHQRHWHLTPFAVRISGGKC